MSCIEVNKEYYKRISEGDLRFLADDGSNWDYYIDSDKVVYSVAKKKQRNQVCSSYFGDYEYFLNRIVYNHNTKYKIRRECYKDLEDRTKFFLAETKEKIFNRVKIL